jgi:hypothetical protein
MPRGQLAFKQRDVARALRATTMAGMQPDRVEIDREGKIIVIFGKPLEDQERNEWDDAV